MQIQRIQTVWLIVAFILAVTSMCFPWLKIDAVTVDVKTDIPLLVLSLLAVLMPLIAIFMYGNLRRQKRVTALGALMAMLTVGYAVSLSYLGPNPEAELCITAQVLMTLSAVFDLLARRGMVHDEKLLRSADRLR